MNSKMLTDRKVAQQVKGQGPLWTYVPLFNGYSGVLDQCVACVLEL